MCIVTTIQNIVLDLIFELILIEKLLKYWFSKVIFQVFAPKVFRGYFYENKSFQRNFFTKILATECFINAESFMKIGEHFCTTWLRSHGNTHIYICVHYHIADNKRRSLSRTFELTLLLLVYWTFFIMSV